MSERKDQGEVAVGPVRGRPMLVWAGKLPVGHVRAMPAQPVEVHDPSGTLDKPPADAALWKEWPSRYPRGGLLFHGDNKEVLAHLLANGFRGKVKLVYIDPPFDSGADYIRKVSLRGPKGVIKVEGSGYTVAEQKQYTDIWANDQYLQFMYERLVMIRELMAQDSVIYVHVDPTRSHHVRMILDEVFGSDAFRNEIIWWYWNKFQGNVNRFASNHDVLLCYGQGQPTFRKIREERAEVVNQLKRVWDPISGSLVNAKDPEGNLIYIESDERTVDDVWRLSMLQPADKTENTGFETQKPESILEIVIGSSTDPGDLVLDCFAGSGTTAAVAQRLGRRWIVCDINKGAIQTNTSRIGGIVRAQLAVANGEKARKAQKVLVAGGDGPGSAPIPAQLGFTVWRVNDYDLTVQHVEAVELACQRIGVSRMRTDSFFDGTLGDKLVKVIPVVRPLTALDLVELKRTLDARPDEDRQIVMVCLGVEIAAQAAVEAWNRLRRDESGRDVNRVEVIELRSDPRYGGIFQHHPARARVRVERHGDRLLVYVDDFFSPTVIERLKVQGGIVQPRIDDWRAMVDSVMVDPAYDGAVLRVLKADAPARRTDRVVGFYELPAPAGETTVAVRITDVLGEEVLVTARA